MIWESWNARVCKNWASSIVNDIAVHFAPPVNTAGYWAFPIPWWYCIQSRFICNVCSADKSSSTEITPDGFAELAKNWPP